MNQVNRLKKPYICNTEREKKKPRRYPFHKLPAGQSYLIATKVAKVI